MKILTNVQTAQLAGISQTFAAFLGFVEQDKKSKIKIIGVDIDANREISNSIRQRSVNGKFTLITGESNYPNIGEATKDSKNLRDLENHYSNLITAYQEIIKKEKPDLILLNGTYFIPWCLYKASQAFTIPVVLHYHGVLSKEIEHWDEKPRLLLNKLEKSFDRKDIYYIFPSLIAKNTVETEVFKHKIKKYSVLPNSVPLHFFQIAKKGNSKKIGFVSRWTKVKNPAFVGKIAKYNQKHGGKFSIDIITDLKKGNQIYQKLSGSVKFKSPRHNNELATFYSKIGVILSPSYFETYGNVAQEALAANTPALISPNMGVAETYIKLGLQDWIIDFSSVKKVYAKANEVSKLSVDPKVRQLLLENYSPDVINRQLVDILKKV